MSASASFVVLEGLDGTGKSTLAKLLAETLKADLLATPPRELASERAAIDAQYCSSPVAAQLFYASTVAHASDRARALIESGRSVVCDRYWLSTVVYDALRPGAVDLDSFAAGLTPATLTVLVEVEEAERQRRLETRGLSASDKTALAHGPKLAKAFRGALKSPLAGRTLILDATRLSPEECVRRVLREGGLS